MTIQGLLLAMVPAEQKPMASGAMQAENFALSFRYQATPKAQPQQQPEQIEEQVEEQVEQQKPVKTATAKPKKIATPKPQPASAKPQPVEQIAAEELEQPPVKEKLLQQSESIAAAPAKSEQGIHQTIVTEPLFARSPTPPSYPSIARKRGQQGIVWIDVMLDEQGQQLAADIFKSSGVSPLDRAALEAVKQWQFMAHRINNIAVASHVRIPVEFSLD
ncbi:energy transducer TonB [Oceanicoccus sagamiensis]|nr:energy transducer TonB [Oceanicoccus sagamiensis]